MPCIKSLFHGCVGLFAALVLSAPAFASSERLHAAIEAVNLEALRAEGAAGSPAERKLADAIELAWTLHDAEAVAAFPAAIAMQSDASLRAAGLWELMAVHARQGEFMAAVGAGEAASQIEPPTASLKQALDFFRALVTTPPTRPLTEPTGTAAITRDLAGLRRANITVGGVTAGAILDTGANFSTITETLAKKMGLRMLEANVSVGSSSRDAVASRLGVADVLEIGGAKFSSVVFIVLPDKDLSFANGAYTIDAILGMPVFFAMHRIAFTTSASGESFQFGGKVPFTVVGLPDTPKDERSRIARDLRNIVFSSLSPLASLGVTVAGKPERLSLLLDSGAQTTSLEERLVRDYPALVEGAAGVKTTRGGAGGTTTTDKARRIPKLDLTVGGKTISLTDIDVNTDTPSPERHGILGLDALGGNFAIDWDAGVLTLN